MFLSSTSRPLTATRCLAFADCRRHRRGAILSYELILVLPIAVALVLSLIEFGLLWSAAHKVQLATQNACRAGTRPSATLHELDREVRLAANTALIDKRLIESHRLTFYPGSHTGDHVVVELQVPMSAASPDMLSIIGYSLRGRWLTSRVVMSKE
jgi:hypothetical protein